MNRILFLSVIISFNLFGQVPSYVPTVNLSAWYSFSGNTNDGSINSLNATNYNSLATDDRFTNIESAYSMDGNTNTYMEVLNPTNELLDAGTGDFTISLWYKTSGTNQSLLHKRTMGGTGGLTNYNGYSMFVNLDGRATFDFEDTNFDFTAVADTAQTNDNNWHNMVVVRNVTEDSVFLYVDGIRVDSREDLTTVTTTSTTDLYIGKWTNYPAYSLDGSIDDIGIWKTALTPCEIQDLYNAGLNSITNSVNQSGATLTANQTGANYQWWDCDNTAILIGETNPSFTPAVTGNYSATIDVNGCEVVSDCYLVDYTSVEQLVNSQNKQLVKIVNLLGQEVDLKPNTVLIYHYSDGSSEKVFYIK